MNVFVLHRNPRIAARMMCDKHVVKMTLESAQLLSTAHHKAGSATPIMYRESYPKHPCNLWLIKRAANYRWLYVHYLALGDEYTYRYGKRHKSMDLRHALFYLPATLRDDAHEQSYDCKGWPLCMPDEYKDYTDVVKSYRAYYLGEKGHMLQYTRRTAPDWTKG